MNFYNMNKSIGLAKNIDIDDSEHRYLNTNIFTVSDNIQDIYTNFLMPNIKRKLGSYVILDFKGEFYNLSKSLCESAGYQVEYFTLNDSFNVFENVNGDDEIQALTNTILKNCSIIQKYLYEGHTEVDLLYSHTDLILNLILIYLCEKAPVEKRTFSYIKKILQKLNQSDFEYFKKIFGKVNSSYKINRSLFHLNYMKENEYKESLSVIIKALSNATDTMCTKSTIFEHVESLYTNRKLKIIFIEPTNNQVIDSFFCSYMENNCYTADVTHKALPIFYVYSPLEAVGYISNLDTIITDYSRKNDVHILNFNDISTTIKVYGKAIRNIMKDIGYGLIFQTNNEKNLKYMPKLLSDGSVADMMEQILVNQAYLVLYRNRVKTSVEQKLTEDEEIEEENISEDIESSSDAASAAIQKMMDSIETKEDLIKQLKKDIDSEADSIKRQHFINLYNNFANE